MMKPADAEAMRLDVVPSLREQIVERLRLAIASGRFAPGARLIERELCELMGVSRTSIREALRELQADGLITAQPNKGLRVAVISPEDARSIYEVRAELEGLAAAAFARNASADQLAALSRSVERLATVYSDFSAEAFIAAKAEFYEILVAGGGNKVAADMLRRVQTRVSQLRVMTVANPQRSAQSIAELRGLLEALTARDAERARQLCITHVENAARAALTVLAKVPHD